MEFPEQLALRGGGGLGKNPSLGEIWIIFWNYTILIDIESQGWDRVFWLVALLQWSVLTLPLLSKESDKYMYHSRIASQIIIICK